jgi:hypothetical protein
LAVRQIHRTGSCHPQVLRRRLNMRQSAQLACPQVLTNHHLTLQQRIQLPSVALVNIQGTLTRQATQGQNQFRSQSAHLIRPTLALMLLATNPPMLSPHRLEDTKLSQRSLTSRFRNLIPMEVASAMLLRLQTTGMSRPLTATKLQI